ncbi:MAG: SH3 domain-containing protein [Anaerolineae bacterium]|nr:SH3 domain-containing protein [Anaerolineae bacterium]
MKLKIASLTLLLLLVVTIIGADGKRITIPRDHVRVRYGPNTEYVVISHLNRGDQVEYIGRDHTGDWIKVDLDGIQGWVSADFVVGLEVDVMQLPIVEDQIARVLVDTLNVRSDPLYDALIVGKVSRDVILTLTGRDDGGEWIRVQNGTLSGWVVRVHLSIPDEAYFMRLPLISRAHTPTPIPTETGETLLP